MEDVKRIKYIFETPWRTYLLFWVIVQIINMLCQQVLLFNSCQYTFLRSSLDATEVKCGQSVSAPFYRAMFFNVQLFWLHFCVSKQNAFHVPIVPSMLLSSVIHIFLFSMLNCNRPQSRIYQSKSLGQFIRSDDIVCSFALSLSLSMIYDDIYIYVCIA